MPAQKLIDETTVIYPGPYVVGTDIQAGQYLITCAKLLGDYSSCCLDIFYNENAYKIKDYGDGGEYHYLDLGENYAVNLTDGMVLYFYRGIGNIQPR